MGSALHALISFLIRTTSPSFFPTIDGAPSVITPERLFNLMSKRISINFNALKISQLFVVPFIGKSAANSSVILKLESIPRTKIAN